MANTDDPQLLVHHGDDVVSVVRACCELRHDLSEWGAGVRWVDIDANVRNLPDDRRPAAERIVQTYRDRIAAIDSRHPAVLQVLARAEDAIVLANPDGLTPRFAMHWNDSSAVHVMVRLAGDVLAHHGRGEFGALLRNHELEIAGLEQLQHRVRTEAARLRRAQRHCATIDDVPAELRVTFKQALAGVPGVVPGLHLPPTPLRTLQRWLKQHAGELGTSMKAQPATQRPLVRGLLMRHSNPRRGTRAPMTEKH